MPRCQGGIDELIRGIPGIGLVRAGVNLNGEFHLVLSQGRTSTCPVRNVLSWLGVVTLPRHHKNVRGGVANLAPPRSHVGYAVRTLSVFGINGTHSVPYMAGVRHPAAWRI